MKFVDDDDGDDDDIKTYIAKTGRKHRIRLQEHRMEVDLKTK